MSPAGGPCIGHLLISGIAGYVVGTAYQADETAGDLAHRARVRRMSSRLVLERVSQQTNDAADKLSLLPVNRLVVQVGWQQPRVSTS